MATTPAPIILGIYYNPGELLVIWRPDSISGLTGYQLTVKAPDGTETQYDSGPTDTQMTVPLNITGESGYSVALAAIVNEIPGDQTSWYELLTVAPVMQLIIYDTSPADSLSVQWEAVTQAGVANYVTTLSKTDSPTHSQTSSKTHTQFNLTLQAGYSVTVRAMDSTQTVQGPASDSYTPLLQAPIMQLITYDLQPAASLSVQWAAVNETGVASYVAVLSKAGSSPNVQNTTATQTQFDLTLQGTYSVTVRAVDSTQIVQGPASISYTPLLLATTMQLITYNLQPAANLSVQWEAVNESGVASYVAVLAKSGSSPNIQNTTNTQTQFDLVLQGTYGVTVRTQDSTQIVQGPASNSYTPLLLAPTMQSVIYTTSPADSLSLTWSEVTESGVAGYVAVLEKIDTSPVVNNTTDTQTQFDLSLQGTYSTSVRTTDDTQIVQGPPTESYTPLLQAPTVQLVSYNTTPSAKLQLQWLAMSVTGVDGYIASLVLSGADPQDQYTSANTLDFDQALTSEDVVYVRASDSTQIVQGPISTSYSPITVSSNVTSLAYDDAQTLIVNWGDFTGDTRIDGSQVQIAALPPQQVSASGPASIPIDITGNDNVVYVRPTSGSVLVGPQGNSLTAITAEPVAISMLWDNTNLIVQWQPVSDPSVTEYSVVLSENSTAQPALSTPAPPCNIPLANLTQNTRYTSTIQASKPGVTGPLSAILTGPYRATLTYTIDTQGRLTEENWSGLSTISYTTDSAGNISSVTPTPDT